MTLDDRGRLWVVESHSYPNWITNDRPGHDRILILEDTQGKGRYDSCKVFLDQGTNLSGIALGFGGVWLCATPRLLFIPVRPGEDRPSGPAVTVLDGWDTGAKHNVFNTLLWGPDGWLYGCHGILATAYVGKPGTPREQRVPFNCGVWRYHPVKERFEVVAWGTTNPWGLDWDDKGEIFITNCVIKHLFHFVPGGHYQRMYGQDLNPHCYELMESCADHIHWGGGYWTTSRGGGGAHDAPGGGHAHVGAMIYLGDSWPAPYRGHLFTCNLHGSRLNQDVFERQGSGYVAHHGQDFLMAHDPWFRGLTLFYGPDGSVFVSDWHDTGECHDYDRVEPCGRIFKISHGRPAAVRVDLERASDAELVRLQLHRNDWWVRHARRLLQERARAGKLDPSVRPALQKMLAEQTDESRKLRALWALHGIGGLEEDALAALLETGPEAVRVWAVRLLTEDRRVSDAVGRMLVERGKTEPASVVRLALASALQHLPAAQAWPLAQALLGHAGDSQDANLPLMLWYGIERHIAAEPVRAVALLEGARLSLVRRYIARRISEDFTSSPGLEPLIGLLGGTSDTELQRDILRGMHDSLQGRRQLIAPKAWSAVFSRLSASKDAEVREKVQLVSLVLGHPEALAVLHRTARSSKADAAARQRAVQALVERQAPDLLPLLRELLADPALRGSALRGLASIKSSHVPELVLRHYSTFSDPEKADAVQTLASRPAFARALLDALEKGTVARRDISPYAARQLLALKDPDITARLNKLWGAIRPADRDKTRLLARYKKIASADALAHADRRLGRQLFAKTCASCHTLFDAGAQIGPNLTGSQRANPEYILSKVLDPNAVVARDYQVSVLTTTDGRTLSGIVKQEDSQTLTLQTPTEAIRLAKADVEERRQTNVSMMPEGLLAPLSDQEVRALLAYLAGANQVPLPEEKSPRR
jgi:putative membrane-bound dehydrogenase-like protein